MSKILYPIGTEVAIRVVSKPVKLIVKSYTKGSHTPYELKRADGKKSDHLKTARYNVGQLISWKNHKTNKAVYHPERETATQTQTPSLTREEIAQIIDDVFDEYTEQFSQAVTELHSHVHEVELGLHLQINQPVDENE